MFVVIVRSLNAQGHRGLNPFEFVHADLIHASSTFEGVRYPSMEGFTTNFGNVVKKNAYEYTDTLYELYKACGVLNSNATNIDITSAEWRNGTTIIPFQFDTNSIVSNVTSYDTAPGILSLALRFAKPTEEALSVFCFQLVNANVFIHPSGLIVSS